MRHARISPQRAVPDRPLILVTGACGYVGAHTVRALSEQGFDVAATDLAEETGNDISAHASSFFAWDIRQPAPPDAGRLHNAAAIVHLAALVSVEESVSHPTDYYRTNILGTLNVLQEFPASKFVFASTGTAFFLHSPYAISKFAAEAIVREKCAEYTILRFFNVAGSNGFSSFSDPPHLVRRAAMAARGEIPSLSIYGSDYDTKDGTCVRDYVHVEDIADALCRAVSTPAMMTEYECLGSGEPYTVREVIETMQRVSGNRFPVVEKGRRKGDPPVIAVPTVSTLMRRQKSLEDMCRSALATP